ncbi:MAG: membrane protein insertion efficiency factor YidD [Micrococcales bacterium]|nr:membrane protein insertion efficiency factor YidD [Micrococcales bacterium]
MTAAPPQASRSLITRVLSWPLEALILLYQRVISPLTPPTCRYYPSCSAYALTAIRRHGPLTGTRLAVWRLLRCNPWSAGGVDHVPPREPHGPADTH